MKIIFENDLEKWLDTRRYLDNTKELESVRTILKDVKERGDLALLEKTLCYDGVRLTKEQLRVESSVLEQASVSHDVSLAMKAAKDNIETYQQFLMPSLEDSYQNGEGYRLGVRYIPMDRVGIYIPGGSAPLLSTVLMTVIPAKIAGVKEIALVSPPTHNGDIHPAILYACRLCGVDEVYRIGGAQAIGALGYGTETIPPVDKIVGPGNIYVSMAKKEMFGYVDIDSIAGPSEIMIVTDDTAPIDWVVADLMSQAEHDPLSSCYLICLSESYVERVREAFKQKMESMPRRDIIEKSWNHSSFAFVVDTLEDSIEIINSVAPEHLELMFPSPEKLLPQIRHAGAIFMGNYSPEALGDYFAGPSHVLPTNGSARFFSPLSVMSFLKTSSLIFYEQSFLAKNASMIIDLALLENLEAHANSIRVRMDQ